MNIRERVGIHAYGKGTIAQQEYARKIGTPVYQVFLGSPQRYWARKEEPDVVSKYAESVDRSKEMVIAHAPYLINLADDSDSRNWKMSLKSMQSISSACVERNIPLLVFHAGSDKGRGLFPAIESLVLGLKELSSEFPSLIYCLENSAYKSNIFSSLDALAAVVVNNGETSNVGIAFDTAHYWSAGGGFGEEDMRNISQLSPLIEVVHLNNHPKPQGCNLDRHSETALPDGQIPMEVFYKLLSMFQCPAIMELEGDAELVDKSYNALQGLIDSKGGALNVASLT